MNIEDLTIGEARSIAALFGSQKAGTKHPATGRYVIVRTYSAGVHAGVLQSSSGAEAHLVESRRIWSWSGALSCSELAITGPSDGKISVMVPDQSLVGVIEIIPATQEAEKCLRNFK